MFNDTLIIDLKSINYHSTDEDSQNEEIKIVDDIKVIDIDSSEVKITYIRSLKTKYNLTIEFEITLYANDNVDLQEKGITANYFKENFEKTIGISANYMSNLVAQITGTLGEIPMITPPMFIKE